MVASKTHPRKSSQGGSSGQSSHRTRRRASLRRQSEKTPASPTLPRPNQKRSKSVSGSSAPVEVPRLTIADRFMSSNQPAPLPPSVKKSPSTISNSFTALSDISGTRLSVADRFMSTTSPTLSLQSIQRYRERSTSNVSASKDSVPGRLTIADAFMKSSTSSPTTRSRAASFADELDVSPNRTMNSRKPSQEHRPSKSTFFDDAATSFLNLDLSLSLSSPTSSIHPPMRPWGSQETLVHVQDKKKPIYAQFMDAEKNTTDLSLGDYDDKKTLNDDHSVKLYEEYEEIDIGFETTTKYYQDWEYDDYGDEEQEKTSYDDSTVGSTTKLRQVKTVRDEHNQEQGQGFWIGCCFISCGTRPSQRVIEQKKRDLELQQVETKQRRCGFSRRGWVFCTFLSLILFVLISYFLWPRTPLMRIEGASLTSPAKITETKQGVMVGNVAFESEWLVNITVDNRQNHVPTRLVQVQVIAKDALTGLIIGKGVHNDDPNPEHILLAPNMISTIQIPIRVDYQARDSTDTTFVDLSKACAPHRFVAYNSPDSFTGNAMREALPLHFWITLHFFGLDWLGYKPTVIATPATGGFACPQL